MTWLPVTPIEMGLFLIGYGLLCAGLGRFIERWFHGKTKPDAITLILEGPGVLLMLFVLFEVWRLLSR